MDFLYTDALSLSLSTIPLSLFMSSFPYSFFDSPSLSIIGFLSFTPFHSLSRYLYLLSLPFLFHVFLFLHDSRPTFLRYAYPFVPNSFDALVLVSNSLCLKKKKKKPKINQFFVVALFVFPSLSSFYLLYFLN